MHRIIGLIGLVTATVLAGLWLLETKSAAQSEASPAAGSAPKFSAFASADDLAYELNFLVADLEKAVADQTEFDSQIENRFVRDSNIIALLATALALHDQENTVKPHAQAIIAATDKLREAKDFPSTKKAVGDLKTLLQGSAAGEVKWRKIAAFKSLMNDEVSSVNNKLKTGLKHFKDRAKLASANAATMALIAENAKLYLAETKKPTEGAQWAAFTDQFRTAAAELAAKARAEDEAGAARQWPN